MGSNKMIQHPQSQDKSLDAAKSKAFVRVTLLGSFVDLALGLIKLCFGWIGQSTALIVDGVHSLSDLATDVLVIVMGKLSYEQADERHPYGHRRFETLGAVLLGATLILVAGMISWAGGVQLFQHFVLGNPKPVPHSLVVWVALFSAVIKELVFHYTISIAKQTQSNLLIANAWHSRSDAISSILVCFGVGVASFGYAWVDSLLALGIGLYIAFIGGKIVFDSLGELVDQRGLSKEDSLRVHDLVTSIPGIVGIHELRSRRMGAEVLLDLHLDVEAYITVSEGHFLGECVVQCIHEHLDHVREVIFHIDPIGAPHRVDQLPSREAILLLFSKITCDEMDKQEQCYWQYPDSITLHYLKTGINMVLTYSMPSASSKITKIVEKKQSTDAVFMAQSIEEWQMSQALWKKAINHQNWPWLLTLSFNLNVQ